MLEAKDLPQCELSRVLEARIAAMLEQDRRARAFKEGKSVGEVPAVPPLTVRVVNNVMKKCEVKPKFYDAFKGEGYPEAFPYRQKVSSTNVIVNTLWLFWTSVRWK